MGRKVILLLIIALMAFAPAYALRNLTYSETEKVALSPIVADPDNDAIEIEYSPPLDANGEWQTDYGDAGQYNITLTVSDGENRVAEELLLVISRKEEPPVIISSAPAEEEIEVDEGGSVKASIEAQDPNKDRLRYSWLLDGDDVAEAMEFTYKPGYSDAGDHVLVVVISDHASETRKEWKIKVNNADFEGIIGAISDVIIAEGETARIDIPDLGKHGLKYEISEPIGQDNYWKTGYDDAGMYNVNLRFYKEGLELAKNIAVSVHNVDRPPRFAPIGAKSVPEGSELRMELKAEDPDGDAIKFSSDSLPEGARIEGNAFIWTPGFDAVRKSSIINSIEDKLRILQETYVVSIAAESNGLSAKQDALIVVWDANRPPVLEVNDVTVKEGETVEIKPEYSDPDGQKVKISYSGWLDTGTYKTSFDDQGAYYVKVTASDGILETYRHVKVTVVDTNREPVFAPMQSQSVFENSTLQIRLLASDPDNDKMEFSVKNPPQNSKMDGNVFTWTPSYDFAPNGSRSIDLEFEVSDGKSGAKSTAQVEVKDANRKPKILSAEPKQLTIKAGKPVTFEVNAIDEDNDELAYIWDFGLFDRYKGGSRHKRIFNSKGEKNVKVKVSDGIYETEHTWKIKVV